MTLNLKIALIIMTIIYLVLIFKEIKNKKLQISFSTFWIISGILLIIAIAIPNFIEPVNMLFCITIFVAFYLIFHLTVKLSKESQKNTLLIQELSILKQKVDKLEEKIDGNQ